MTANGEMHGAWGYAVEGRPSTMLQVALVSLRRQGYEPRPLPARKGATIAWLRRVAECVSRGECRMAVVFCEVPCLACCIANKVPGVRAAAVATVAQAEHAVAAWGANLLVAEMSGRTYFEYKQILRLCSEMTLVCPPDVACILEELDGHAHR